MENMEAILALEDGTWFRGVAGGAEGMAQGEVVFNTSMTGYQEVLTDPSYSGQIVTMTCPEIGNYGIAPADGESRAPQVSGFIMREESPVASDRRRARSEGARRSRERGAEDGRVRSGARRHRRRCVRLAAGRSRRVRRAD